VGLFSYYIKSTIKKILFWFSVLFYLISLVNISITSPWHGVESRGIELLLLGWIQTFFGIVTLNIFSALPWLGNIAIFLTFIFIYLDQNKKFCILSSLFGVVCTSSFLFNPHVMMGADLSMITVNVEIGTYMWCGSSVLLFLSVWFIQNMPNKSFKQDK
jgi:uncharacterized membrane protein YfcA